MAFVGNGAVLLLLLVEGQLVALLYFSGVLFVGLVVLLVHVLIIFKVIIFQIVSFISQKVICLLFQVISLTSLHLLNQSLLILLDPLLLKASPLLSIHPISCQTCLLFSNKVLRIDR